MDSGSQGKCPLSMGGMDPGLVGLHMKVVFTGESFSISWNWLALEGAVALGSAKDLNIKTSEIKWYD